MANLSVNLQPDILQGLKKKAAELGMTQTELVAISVASFLHKEEVIERFMYGIGIIEEHIERLSKRQELFTLALGKTACAPESARGAELAQNFAAKIGEIVTATGID